MLSDDLFLSRQVHFCQVNSCSSVSFPDKYKMWLLCGSSCVVFKINETWLILLHPFSWLIYDFLTRVMDFVSLLFKVWFSLRFFLNLLLTLKSHILLSPINMLQSKFTLSLIAHQLFHLASSRYTNKLQNKTRTQTTNLSSFERWLCWTKGVRGSEVRPVWFDCWIRHLPAGFREKSKMLASPLWAPLSGQ